MSTLLQRDLQTIWHPYTQHQTAPLPLPIVRAQGAYIYDEAGKGYLDLISSWLVTTHGHSEPRIAKAIYEQALTLEQVIFSGFTHEPAVSLAERLLALLPANSQGRFSRVFYSDNGSTAVEVALKMAFQYWRNRGEEKRQRFLAFSGAYHGDTFGAMAVGRSCQFYEHFGDLLFPVDFAPFPATWLDDEVAADKETASLLWIENYFKEYRGQVAAVLVEPLIQAVNGMQVCRPAFLRALEALAKQEHILVIYDEVMTGFGRTGSVFACEKAGTQPDIICLAKCLTGGFLPLSVTVCQEHIYEAFLSPTISKALLHGHSYTANPLGCAAALASLDILLETNTAKQWQLIEEAHLKGLKALKALPMLEKMRLCGTMAAFDLVDGGEYGTLLSQQLRQAFTEKGLLLRPFGKTTYLLPPYCVTAAELEKSYQLIFEIFETLASKEKL